MLKRKVLLCHVVTSLEVGGMENGIVNLANNHDRDKFEVLICCLNEAGEMAKRLKKDVRVHVLEEVEGFSLTRILRVARFFRKLRPDIVHAHGWGGGSFYAITGAKLAQVPVVVNGEHGSFFLKYHQVLAQKLLAKMVDVTLSVCESLKDNIEHFLDITAEKIMVIPNGIDMELFSGSCDHCDFFQELREKYNLAINKESFVISCIGSLRPVKNQMLLLKALVEIRNRNGGGNLCCLFVGDGPAFEGLKKFVINNHLEGCVVFLGRRNDIPQVLSASDVLVLTSISEGMSNVILEAFSSGLPVIATKSAGTIELIEDGCSGYLVEQQDVSGLAYKIKLLFGNRDLCGRLGSKACEVARKKYSIANMVVGYEKVYLDLLKGTA